METFLSQIVIERMPSTCEKEQEPPPHNLTRQLLAIVVLLQLQGRDGFRLHDAARQLG
jgi:hypothetical protein